MSEPARNTPAAVAYVVALLTKGFSAMPRLPSRILAALQALFQHTKHAQGLVVAFLASLLSWKSSNPIPSSNSSTNIGRSAQSQTLQYAEEIEALFGKLASDDELLKLSRGLQAEYITALLHNEHCMLPSYNHLLPTGYEKGIYVALDVGGSTFRVAVIELFGRGAVPSVEAWKIMNKQKFKIDEQIKQKKGEEFFDWLAEKIEGALVGTEGLEQRCPLNGERGTMKMGLSWSFPIEHTSLRSGKIHGMGKGFKAMEGMLGMDLADTVQAACDRRNLPLSLIATINDSAATLISRGYNTPHTHYGLILGTGMNMAVHLPVTLLPSKLASRTQSPKPEELPPTPSPLPLPESPLSSESKELSLSNLSATLPDTIDHSHVIVNTELSMFGKELLPMTRFDDALNTAHALPGFQPLEMLVSGQYLGEIARLIISEGITKAQTFEGKMPQVIKKPYSLNAGDLTELENAWIGLGVDGARVIIQRWTGLATVSEEDVEAFVRIVKAVSKRAQQIVAVATYAMRCIRNNAETKRLSTLPNGFQKLEGEGEDEMVACCGGVIESYPGFKEGVQETIDRLCELDSDREREDKGKGKEKGGLKLCIAHESSLLGAAVCAAVVMAAGGNA